MSQFWENEKNNQKTMNLQKCGHVSPQVSNKSSRFKLYHHVFASKFFSLNVMTILENVMTSRFEKK